MVLLSPMNADEFSAYMKRSVVAYARDKVTSGQWSQESSLELSRKEFDELLPQGLSTPGNHVYTLRDAGSHQKVGMLWYAERERGGKRIAYVYDVEVEEQSRRKQFATRAFEALEAEVLSRGLDSILLHVFGHNKSAQGLYLKLGYRPISVTMCKELQSSGT